MKDLENKVRFTPGPWSYIVSKTLIHIETANLGEGTPCGMPVCSIPKSREADARLIAAAPELLEALKEVLDCVGALSNPSEMINVLGLTHKESDHIFNVIAKAEGRE